MEDWNCVVCGAKLIWQNDYAFEDVGLDGGGIVRHYSCPECEAYVIVYIPDKEDNKKRAGD